MLLVSLSVAYVGSLLCQLMVAGFDLALDAKAGLPLDLLALEFLFSSIPIVETNAPVPFLLGYGDPMVFPNTIRYET